MTRQTPPATEDSRAQRQMRLCQELAELGMQLARAAAAQALTSLTEPPAANTPPGAQDPTLLFTRLSRAVRQALLLESRIAAELRAADAPPRPKPPPPRDDRRASLRRLFHTAAARSGRPELKAQAYERLDIELADDPRATASDILATICETLGVELPADLVAGTVCGEPWLPLRPGATVPRPHPPAANRADPPSLWSIIAPDGPQARRT